MPSGVSEVMKLFEDGIPADIMVSYINNSPLSFYLSADNLISLQKEGVPAPVLTTMSSGMAGAGFRRAHSLKHPHPPP